MAKLISFMIHSKDLELPWSSF